MFQLEFVFFPFFFVSFQIPWVLLHKEKFLVTDYSVNFEIDEKSFNSEFLKSKWPEKWYQILQNCSQTGHCMGEGRGQGHGFLYHGVKRRCEGQIF